MLDFVGKKVYILQLQRTVISHQQKDKSSLTGPKEQQWGIY